MLAASQDKSKVRLGKHAGKRNEKIKTSPKPLSPMHEKLVRINSSCTGRKSVFLYNVTQAQTALSKVEAF